MPTVEITLQFLRGLRSRLKHFEKKRSLTRSDLRQLHHKVNGIVRAVNELQEQRPESLREMIEGASRDISEIYERLERCGLHDLLTQLRRAIEGTLQLGQENVEASSRAGRSDGLEDGEVEDGDPRVGEGMSRRDEDLWYDASIHFDEDQLP